MTAGRNSSCAWRCNTGPSTLPLSNRSRAPSFLPARYGGCNRTGQSAFSTTAPCAIPADASVSTSALPGSLLLGGGHGSCRLICMGRHMGHVQPRMGAPYRRCGPPSAAPSSSSGGEISGTANVPPSPSPPSPPPLTLRGAGSNRSPTAATLANNEASPATAAAAGSMLSTSESDEFFDHQSGDGGGCGIQSGEEEEGGGAAEPAALPPGWSQLGHGGDLQTLIQV